MPMPLMSSNNDTLFARAQPEQRLFRAALSAFNNGHEDARTVALLDA